MRHTLGQLTPDLVLGCLAQALPDRVPAEGASCMFDLPMRHAPEVARDGGREFAIEPVHNGGTGAGNIAAGWGSGSRCHRPMARRLICSCR